MRNVSEAVRAKDYACLFNWEKTILPPRSISSDLTQKMVALIITARPTSGLFFLKVNPFVFCLHLSLHFQGQADSQLAGLFLILKTRLCIFLEYPPEIRCPIGTCRRKVFHVKYTRMTKIVRTLNLYTLWNYEPYEVGTIQGF